ncbi:signal transduction histidine kinase [Dyadobacter sp. BE34]|uniref:histidine kinase n=1 Tax=Dyadobacter fermentans TaxID=94254 RepID=A0ABU1R6C4_9BACT|nr:MULTISPECIES: ATP-binding protein [Dyadobacter]MDR6808505.1 signal transduction histidine kinase [Dyadobacter fermentans]MDR7046248.1 signal transduction histidine kinase [Dyadobacter sp. BE242]MDR7200561.1 signal transduction histidine kinase [Dyadobacter sp. BE34]MDR7218521.1 signal transduction histidine kinase [Dyadobacter sp. BE31]MDR7266451.1 signal transduction histidine kinase [Dyadobacter sp. BE32]
MRILLIALISLIMHGFSASAQQERFIVSQYNTDNGLPQNSVKDIAFDEWGYCWLATEMGMVRYDGQRFVTYGPSEIPGLKSARLAGLTADARGTLYARLYGEQIIKVAVSGPHAAPAPKLLPKWSVHVGLQGVAVDDQRMLDKLAYFYNHLGQHPFLFSSSISNKEIYLRNENSLLYLSPELKAPSKIRDYTSGKPEYAIFAGQFLACILPGNRVEAWKNGRLMSVHTSIGGPLASHTRFLSGDFHAFPGHDGLYVYAGDDLYKVMLRNGRLHSEIELEGVHVPFLSCIRFLPRQQTYYLGSATDGLFVVQKKQFTAPRFSSPVLDQSLYAQAKLGEDSLIVRNMLVSMDRPPRPLPIDIGIGPWFFAPGNGELYYEQNFKLNKLYIASGQSRVITSGHGMVHMSQADKGQYFFGSANGFGKLVNDKAVGYKEFPQKANILFARQIRPSYFLVCTEKGLKWYDYEHNRIDKSVLESMPIRTVYAETADKIWISTYGKGFYLLQNKKLYHMPTGPRQALTTVHSFIEDGQGFFWLPSNNGLFKVRKSELQAFAEKRLDKVNFFRFDRTDGLPTNEFNGGCDPSYIWLKDSLLSLPSMKGLVWFYPHKIKPYYPNEGIFADSLTVKGRSIPFNTRGIALSPDFKRLSIHVSSPYFGNPENLDLEYQVAGLDADWHKVEKNGEVTIASLPPGDYKLLVRRNSGDIPDSRAQFVLPVEVQPWFYNTWWFYVFCICVSVGIGYLLFKRRLTKLQKEAQELENVISARTRELKSAVDDLAKSEMALLESNRFKDHVITMVLHDMRSPLRFISLISGNLLKNHKQLTSSDLDAYLGDLHMGTQNLLGFTEQFFMWISTQQQGFKISKNLFPLNALFEEIASLYKELFKVNHNRLTIVRTDLECISDYQILSVIIRNLIDNANKNTTDGEITLSCREENGQLLISISDTGQGLNDEQIALFMSRDRQTGNRGTGSLLIHTMLDYINGSILIASQPGKGSTFTILLQNLTQFDTSGQDGSVPGGS